MKTIKVSEASGIQLDCLVGKCNGIPIETIRLFHDEGHYNYSTDWSQGGPIIEREGIDIQQLFGGGCEGSHLHTSLTLFER